MTFGELRPGDLIIYHKSDGTMDLEMIVGVVVRDRELLYVETTWMKLVGPPYNDGSFLTNDRSWMNDKISVIFTIIRDGHEIA